MGRNDNFVSFEESVSFVTGESELIDAIAYVDSVASHYLPPVLKG